MTNRVDEDFVITVLDSEFEITSEEPHGQRVSKLLTGEDFSEEVVVPASDLHLAS